MAGIGEACRALGTPVTGGNVSFYNESPEGAIFPTPTIGMLGLLEEVCWATTANFKQPGDVIFLLTPAAWLHRNDLGGSEYLAYVHGITAGDAPHLELAEEKAVQEALLTLIRAGLVQSAHDVSDGGLAVCLAECVIFSPGLGATVRIPDAAAVRRDALLFGEAQSRIVFTTSAASSAEVYRLLQGRPVQLVPIGTVEASERLVMYVGETQVLDLERAQLEQAYEAAIPAWFQGA